MQSTSCVTCSPFVTDTSELYMRFAPFAVSHSSISLLRMDTCNGGSCFGGNLSIMGQSQEPGSRNARIATIDHTVEYTCQLSVRRRAQNPRTARMHRKPKKWTDKRFA